MLGALAIDVCLLQIRINRGVEKDDIIDAIVAARGEYWC